MQMQPVVGVIVPIYNVEQYLEECLDSVVNQTYKNLQIVLVDDGSTDGSFEIAKKYYDNDSRITLIQQENRGLSCARNVGLDYCFGDLSQGGGGKNI